MNCIYRSLLPKPTHCFTTQKTTHAQTCVLPNFEISNFKWCFKLFLLTIIWLLLSSFFSRKPTFCTKTLHNLQRQSSGFHCLMAFQNLFNSLISFILLGTRSHIFDPRFEISFMMHCVYWRSRKLRILSEVIRTSVY